MSTAIEADREEKEAKGSKALSFETTHHEWVGQFDSNGLEKEV